MKINTTLKITLLILLFFTTTLFAQKLEKIKGSKIVTTTEIALDSVVSLELFNNVKLTLIQGDQEMLTIFADDNLHDIVEVDLVDGKLSLSMLYRVASKKEFELTLQLIDLEKLVLNDKSELVLNKPFNVGNFTIMMHDKSKANLLFESEDEISLTADEKSKATIGFNAKKITYNLNDGVKIKGSSSSKNLLIVGQDRAVIDIVGKTENLEVKLIDGFKLKSATLVAENGLVKASDKTELQINLTSKLKLDIKDTSKVYFYGAAKVELDGFSNSAMLIKKE